MTITDPIERLRDYLRVTASGDREEGQATDLLDQALVAAVAFGLDAAEYDHDAIIKNTHLDTVDRIKNALQRTSLVGIARSEWGTPWAVPLNELHAILNKEADRDANAPAERLHSHAARSLAADGRWPNDQRHLIRGQLEQVEREVHRATVERIIDTAAYDQRIKPGKQWKAWLRILLKEGKR